MKKLMVVFITIIFCLALCACDSNNADKEPDTSSNVEESTEEATNVSEVVGNTTDTTMSEIETENDNFVEKIISFGFTEDEAVENAKILKQCGIPTIAVCEPTSAESIDNLVVFRGKLDDDRTFWFTVENRKIFYVSLNGEDLYDEDKGGYLKNFNDVHIPETYVSVTVADTLRNKTETVLDSYFTSTRYYDAWAYGREDNQYMVQCQATDGSVLTSNWINCRVWFEQQSNSEFTVTGVQINGKQYQLK